MGQVIAGTPVTVLQPNLAQGTVESATQPWVSGPNNGVTAMAQLSDQDLADPTKTLTMTVLHSFDGGLSYVAAGQATWVGGVKSGITGTFVPPAIGSSFGQAPPPTHTKVQFSLPNPLSVGAGLTFN